MSRSREMSQNLTTVESSRILVACSIIFLQEHFIADNY
jgi:hypothetical protein